ncbi:MAG: hypothetical protein M1817_005576 [Caeruleum heppii]|nr:MAG: hypothetical protein M1817_005576 [Caeruleum heppii]
MISDDDLYSLAIFLGSVAMLLIVLYHFLEVNAKDTGDVVTPAEKLNARSTAQAATEGGKTKR